MLYFFLGLTAGGVLGVFVMCLLHINRLSSVEAQELISKQTDTEKNASVGVDNSTKKA